MPPYVHAEDLRFDRPIYVGKALPKGSRKGGIQFDAGAERSIYSRLRQHARSIDRADNLMLGEFRCRFLVVAPVWIRLAENLIISEYEPVWNAVVDGFGSHDPGKGRYDQEKSRWDWLHPGRAGAWRRAAGGAVRRGGGAGERVGQRVRPGGERHRVRLAPDETRGARRSGRDNGRRAVITGMGAITPLGLNVDDFWQGLIAGKSGIDWITVVDTDGYPA